MVSNSALGQLEMTCNEKPTKGGTCSILKMARIEKTKRGFWYEPPMGMVQYKPQSLQPGQVLQTEAFSTCGFSPQQGLHVTCSRESSSGHLLIRWWLRFSGPAWKTIWCGINCCHLHKETLIWVEL